MLIYIPSHYTHLKDSCYTILLHYLNLASSSINKMDNKKWNMKQKEAKKKKLFYYFVWILLSRDRKWLLYILVHSVENVVLQSAGLMKWGYLIQKLYRANWCKRNFWVVIKSHTEYEWRKRKTKTNQLAKWN